MSKLPKTFYQNPALEIAEDFIGKYLVYDSPKGKMTGVITDVEAYPAFMDEVSHGNKRTKRTEVMFLDGGYAYVYLIHGKHYMFAISANKSNIPEVVFIRSVIPVEGIEIMKENFGKDIGNIKELTKSPGRLCRSFGITKDLYGEDVTGDILYLEDRGLNIASNQIHSTSRVGINPSLQGHDLEYRYFVEI